MVIFPLGSDVNNCSKEEKEQLPCLIDEQVDEDSAFLHEKSGKRCHLEQPVVTNSPIDIDTYCLGIVKGSTYSDIANIGKCMAFSALQQEFLHFALALLHKSHVTSLHDLIDKVWDDSLLIPQIARQLATCQYSFLESLDKLTSSQVTMAHIRKLIQSNLMAQSLQSRSLCFH